MMYNKIIDILGEEIYVISLEGRTIENATTSDYFYNRVGVPMVNDEPEKSRHYDYRIYYKSIGNSWMCHADAIIGYVTMDKNPEYFL